MFHLHADSEGSQGMLQDVKRLHQRKMGIRCQHTLVVPATEKASVDQGRVYARVG